MNSYGDPQSARARARVPGPSSAPTPDEQSGYDEPRPAPDAYRQGSAGRASVGRASVGTGTGSVGSARVGGRASVGTGSVGRPGVEEAYGQGPGYGSRGIAARAAVRPPSSAVGGPGGPEAPGDAAHPRRGSAGKILTKAAKKRRRTNILTAAAAVLVILVGVGVVGGTYFFDSVVFKEPGAEEQTTQILASDNKTPLMTIGEFNRSAVPYQKINPLIGEAVQAAEDKNFREHHGIDMKGIARAAWNNFTGGQTEGASTITQQYARHAADLKDISYNRKLREAVIARKMEEVWSKDEILGRYLNSVYFGRGAYGIEAAVKAYFGNDRSSLTPPGQKGAITAGEAAILASVIKQPEPIVGGHKGYDPQNNLPAAEDRWNYTLNNMVEKGWLNAPGTPPRPTAYPKTWKPFKQNSCATACGNDKPTGMIKKYVMRELAAMGIPSEKITKGGLRIRTTIDEKVQAAAEKAVDRDNVDSPMHDLSKTYTPALVAIDPDNGRVMAYYGGKNGSDFDFAGPTWDAKGDLVSNGTPPGSTFKIYTLLAALSNGYGFDTTWDADKEKVDGGGKINNSNRTSLLCGPGGPRRCPLRNATQQSYNFAFYWLADALGQKTVVDAAHKAGINYIMDKDGKILNLNKDEASNDEFGREVGFGQYNIFPLDHANGVATIANDGVYNKAHFVREVDVRDAKTGEFKPYPGATEKLDPVKQFNADVVAGLQNVLEAIPGLNHKALDGGRPAIGKTGTWELDTIDKETGPKPNSAAWMVGATRQLATAVFIGNEDPKTHKQLAIKQADGSPMSGGSVPGAVWKMFMDAAMRVMNAADKDFLPNTTSFVDPNKKGNGLPEPVVQQPPSDQPCVIPILCGNNGNDGGNGNNENGNGNNGNGNNGNGNGNNGNGDNTGQDPGQQPGTRPTLPTQQDPGTIDDGNNFGNNGN
jgi:membrane peptidoglycan carboxypeptidase